MVPQLRAHHSWDNAVRALNRRGRGWTVEQLRWAVHGLVREKLADPELLARSPRRALEDHLINLVAAIAIAERGLSLRYIAAQLDRMGERLARGGRKWQPSSVLHLLDEAIDSNLHGFPGRCRYVSLTANDADMIMDGGDRRRLAAAVDFLDTADDSIFLLRG